MNINSILEEIDSEIAKLRKAHAALSNGVGIVQPVKSEKRAMSAKARRAIAAAQRARWAKFKAAKKK